MKTLNTTITVFSLLIIYSFILPDKDLEKYLLQVGDTFIFNNKPSHEKEVSSAVFTKGANDGSGFELRIDSTQHITLCKIRHSNGPKQDELLVIGCTGTMTRNKDKVTFTFNKWKGKYYLIDLNQSKIIDSFEMIQELNMSAEDFKGKPAEFYYSEKAKSDFRHNASHQNGELAQFSLNHNTTSISLTAVPPDMKREDLFKALHPENTLARFTQMVLIDDTNRKVVLPSGNYIICEGTSLDIR